MLLQFFFTTYFENKNVKIIDYSGSFSTLGQKNLKIRLFSEKKKNSKKNWFQASLGALHDGKYKNKKNKTITKEITIKLTFIQFKPIEYLKIFNNNKII